MQNKKELLKKKVDLIRKNSKVSDVYIRNFIRRHPEVFLKSLASFEAKITYIQKKLGRYLSFEPTFPLLLNFSYTDVIKPRCEIFKAQQKPIKFEEILALNDKDFCKKFNVHLNHLEKRKNQIKSKKEKDVLWAYVPGL